MSEPLLRVISLGAGVQSTRLALGFAHGEFGGDRIDAAIFADTGDEPQAVYEHLDWLRSDNVLPFPVIVIKRPMSIGHAIGAAADAHVNGHQLFGQLGSPPFFVRERGDYSGMSDGMLSRQCTDNWKIDPIDGAVQRLLAERLGKDEARARMRAGEILVEQCLGISADEAQRMKPARKKWVRNRYPLAMEARESRNDCLRWMERHGYPRPPRSACVFCPYKSDNEWRYLRDHDPEGWARAVALDERMREGLDGMSRTRQVFVHRSRVPLAEVDLSTAEDLGQLGLWGEECAGMCGV